jgi:hypothetical protein
VGTISGTIMDTGGIPVANATVTLTNMTSSMSDGIARITETDAVGNYAFYDIALGDYTLTVTKDGYNSTTSNVSMTSEGISSGGMTVSAVIQAQDRPGDSTLAIEIMAIAAIFAAILLATLLVYRKRNHNG